MNAALLLVASITPNWKCYIEGAKLQTRYVISWILSKDFFDFKYILCMDNSNYQDLMDVRPNNSTAIVSLLGKFDPQGESIIADPYYGGKEGFEKNFRQITRCCTSLLEKEGH